MTDKIFTVTTLHFLDQKYGASPRTVAWYSRLEAARQCVLANMGDIWESTYRFAVVEEVEPGLYPAIKSEHWFEWYGDHTGGYEPCDKPQMVEGVSHFAIG